MQDTMQRNFVAGKRRETCCKKLGETCCGDFVEGTRRETCSCDFEVVAQDERMLDKKRDRKAGSWISDSPRVREATGSQQCTSEALSLTR